MDVSNSTGSGTDYRVMAGGAAPIPRGSSGAGEPLYKGTLQPQEYVTLKIAKFPCVVQFLRAGKVIAQLPVEPAKTKEQDVLIALVPHGRGIKPHLCRRKA